MKYRFVSMFPGEGADSVITLHATPNWLEEQCGVRAKTIRYYGSGQDWREGDEDGPPCGWLASDRLYEIWNDHWDCRKGVRQEQKLDDSA